MYTNMQRMVWVFLVTFILAACNSGDTVEPMTGNDSAFTETSKNQTQLFSVNIKTNDALGNDVVEFSQGQQIYYEMTITSLIDESQIMAFADSGYPAFCIRRTGTAECLWSSRFGKAFTQAIVESEFAAFETKEYESVVEQVDNEGFAFGAGEFEIRGVGGRDSDEELLGSTWHAFTISE